MKFAPPHSSRIMAMDSQFNFDDGNLTTALLGVENLLAIAEIDDTTTTIAGLSQKTITFQWDTSLGNFSSTTKNDRIQIAILNIANGVVETQAGSGAWSGGSDGNGGIDGYEGGIFQLNKYSNTNDGRMVSICSQTSAGYHGYFDGTLSSNSLSMINLDSTGGYMYMVGMWYDDDGVSIRLQNVNGSTRTVDIQGYAYGFC